MSGLTIEDWDRSQLRTDRALYTVPSSRPDGEPFLMQNRECVNCGYVWPIAILYGGSDICGFCDNDIYEFDEEQAVLIVNLGEEDTSGEG